MMNTQWTASSVNDAMMLTYGDFRRLPKNDKRSILRSLPIDEFESLTAALKVPASSWPDQIDQLTLRELIQRLHGG
jgi:hypothetical protein